jgi:hypothetical protein
VASKPLVPCVSIFHLPTQRGLPASKSTHPLSCCISLVDEQSDNLTMSGTRTIVLAVNSKASLSQNIRGFHDQLSTVRDMQHLHSWVSIPGVL